MSIVEADTGIRHSVKPKLHCKEIGSLNASHTVGDRKRPCQRFDARSKEFWFGQQPVERLAGAFERCQMKAPEDLLSRLDEGGSVFGMAAMTKPRRYNVTAMCKENVTALAIDAKGLEQIIRREPINGLEVMAELAHLYSMRLNNARAVVNTICRIFASQGRKSGCLLSTKSWRKFRCLLLADTVSQLPHIGACHMDLTACVLPSSI